MQSGAGSGILPLQGVRGICPPCKYVRVVLTCAYNRENI